MLLCPRWYTASAVRDVAVDSITEDFWNVWDFEADVTDFVLILHTKPTQNNWFSYYTGIL
jgi:hypothetical protein